MNMAIKKEAMEATNVKKRNRVRKEVKLEIVYTILSGELFLEEAMAKYGIRNEISIINWIKEYRSEVEIGLHMTNDFLDHRKAKDESLLVTEIYKKIQELEEANQILKEEKAYLANKVLILEREISQSMESR
jgi:transposase-like protein